jgi:hypothetical protein
LFVKDDLRDFLVEHGIKEIDPGWDCDYIEGSIKVNLTTIGVSP